MVVTLRERLKWHRQNAPDIACGDLAARTHVRPWDKRLVVTAAQRTRSRRERQPRAIGGRAPAPSARVTGASPSFGQDGVRGIKISWNLVNNSGSRPSSHRARRIPTPTSQVSSGTSSTRRRGWITCPAGSREPMRSLRICCIRRRGGDHAGALRQGHGHAPTGRAVGHARRHQWAAARDRAHATTARGALRASIRFGGCKPVSRRARLGRMARRPHPSTDRRSGCRDGLAWTSAPVRDEAARGKDGAVTRARHGRPRCHGRKQPAHVASYGSKVASAGPRISVAFRHSTG